MFGLPSLLFLVRYPCEQQESNLDASHRCFTWRSVGARLLHCHLCEELHGADSIALFRIVITNKTTVSRRYRRWQPACLLWRGIKLCPWAGRRLEGHCPLPMSPLRGPCFLLHSHAKGSGQSAHSFDRRSPRQHRQLHQEGTLRANWGG